MKLCRKLVALCSMVVFACVAYADTVMLNYQGRLKQKDGPLVNGNVQMEFRMYDDTDGGVCLYQETNLVMVVDGVYSVVLGKNPIMGDLGYAMQSSNAYLEVIINGNPLRPREKYVRPGSAHNATSADTAIVAETSTVSQVAVFAESATENWRSFCRVGCNTSILFDSARHMSAVFAHEPMYQAVNYQNSDGQILLFSPQWHGKQIQSIKFFKTHQLEQEDPTFNLQYFVWIEVRRYDGALARTVTTTNTFLRDLPLCEWVSLPIVTNTPIQSGDILVIQSREMIFLNNEPTFGSCEYDGYYDVQVK